MTRIKRTLSLVMSVVLTTVLVLSTLISAGITVEASSSPTVSYELWMLIDYEHALIRGTKTDISDTTAAAPYAHSTDTAYIPLAAVAKYKSATYTLDGDVITVTHSDGSTATLTAGSLAWSGGELMLPPVVDGEDVYLSIMSANSVFGTKSIYNKDIGLIILYDGALTSSNGLKTHINTLGNLLFDRPTGAEVYADILSTVGSADTHPRLLADQATFDRLRDVYKAGITNDIPFTVSLGSFAAQCNSAFNTYFYYDEETGVTDWRSEGARLSCRQPYYIYDENGNRLVGQTSYTYTNEKGEEVTLTPGGSERGDGYDFGGRSNVGAYTEKLKKLAFLWQMTGEQKYVDAFYLFAVELGKWEHWGEGHFLNVADGSVEFAIGLDWIYHGFDSQPEKRDELAAILYEKGMMKGYYAIVCDSLYKQGSTPRIDLTSTNASRQYQYGTHPSLSGQQAKYLSISYTAGTGGWRTINRDNNWQTVCGSGMIVSALLLSEYEGYRENALFVIEQYLLSLERCLLQYAPDGAYIESPGYWGYGTNTLMITLAALLSSCGTTYGYEDIVGLHDSFYFTIGIADGKYQMWNYHDSGEGSIDYTSFYFASRLYDDPTLAYLRDKMSFGFKTMEVLYYDDTLAEGAHPESVPLDFNFKGIDTATFHSSYEADGVFTGLHVGPNHVTHGDMDCGNFMLSMGGVKWTTDVGPENYNVSGFWNSGENGKRYKLYAKSLEGHSTVVIRNDSSLPRGQKYTTASTSGYAVIDEFVSDELGGYAISDMTTEYGANCTSGKRGVLLTNSRSTVVLQDEISFSKATDLTWILNINHHLSISQDGRQFISTYNVGNGEQIILRATLLSNDASLKFRKMGTPSSSSGLTKYETVLPDTYTKTNNNDPLAKDPTQRVVIEANGVTQFNVAVVFQIERHVDEIVAYEYTPMDEWQTVSDEWVKEANSWIKYEEPKPIVPQYTYKQFYNANERLAAAYEAGDIALVGEILRETHYLLSSYNENNQSIASEAARYRAYRRTYNLMIRDANSAFSDLLFD